MLIPIVTQRCTDSRTELRMLWNMEFHAIHFFIGSKHAIAEWQGG